MWSTCWGTTFESMKYLLCLSSVRAVGIYVMSFPSTFIYFVWDGCYLKQKVHCKWKFIEDIKENFKFDIEIYKCYIVKMYECKFTVLYGRFWWCFKDVYFDHWPSNTVKVHQGITVNSSEISSYYYLCPFLSSHKLLI